ncbi:uncharacterized protein BO96DRAFT_328847 [Aspergillus niger CBS 101883]|uniref:uncharacterized protein n=1 Tax=Aspergillus lacticoffeatus (strain CBS 101883) TaxID=1450533 RepID=UPI000D7F7AD5|nr:uncharacterized protein BO96DRAFT_328847 [Aspergillus niger CBS 101883]PYH60220.1 hypothetical protein BO96DRAFT_328847 [Aspergillus niger CBS 101883]
MDSTGWGQNSGTQSWPPTKAIDAIETVHFTLLPNDLRFNPVVVVLLIFPVLSFPVHLAPGFPLNSRESLFSWWLLDFIDVFFATSLPIGPPGTSKPQFVLACVWVEFPGKDRDRACCRSKARSASQPRFLNCGYPLGWREPQPQRGEERKEREGRRKAERQESRSLGFHALTILCAPPPASHQYRPGLGSGLGSDEHVPRGAHYCPHFRSDSLLYPPGCEGPALPSSDGQKIRWTTWALLTWLVWRALLLHSLRFRSGYGCSSFCYHRGGHGISVIALPACSQPKCFISLYPSLSNFTQPPPGSTPMGGKRTLSQSTASPPTIPCDHPPQLPPMSFNFPIPLKLSGGGRKRLLWWLPYALEGQIPYFPSISIGLSSFGVKEGHYGAVLVPYVPLRRDAGFPVSVA